MLGGSYRLWGMPEVVLQYSFNYSLGAYTGGRALATIMVMTGIWISIPRRRGSGSQDMKRKRPRMSNNVYLLNRRDRGKLQPAFVRSGNLSRRRSLDDKDEGLLQYAIILVLIAVCTIIVFTFLAGQMAHVFITLDAAFGSGH